MARARGAHHPSRWSAALGLAVAGIDLDRAGIGLDRLGAVVQLGVAEAEARPRLGIVGVHVQRGVEVLDRRFVFAGPHQALPARLVGGAGEGIAIDGVVEIGDRLNVVALALIDEPARVIGLRAFGIEPDRLVEVGEGAVEVVCGPERLPRPR